MAPNYKPLIYRAQGATEFVVDDGGILTVHSGGEIEAQSGSTIDLQSGSVVKYNSTAVIGSDGVMYAHSGIKIALETGSSLTNLLNHGISLLNPTTSAVYTLDAPVAGVVKHIIKTQATTTLTATVYAGPTTTVTWDGSNTKLLISQKQNISLVGGSSLRWYILPSTIIYAYTSDVVASSS